HRRADLDDAEALRRFAAEVDVVTFEFENVSSAALEAAAAFGAVHPSPAVLHTTQHRGREKAFLREHGLPLARFELVQAPSALRAAVERVGPPCVVKTAGFGYDGKGQVVVTSQADHLSAALDLAQQGPVVVEELVDLAAELSVVVARSEAGEVATYAPFVNRHAAHVLDVSVAPFVS